MIVDNTSRVTSAVCENFSGCNENSTLIRFGALKGACIKKSKKAQS